MRLGLLAACLVLTAAPLVASSPGSSGREDSWVEKTHEGTPETSPTKNHAGAIGGHASYIRELDSNKPIHRVNLNDIKRGHKDGHDEELVEGGGFFAGKDGKICWIGISDTCNGVSMSSFNMYVWISWAVEFIMAILVCSCYVGHSREAACGMIGGWALANAAMGCMIYFHVITFGDKGLEQFYGFDLLSAGVVGVLVVSAAFVSLWTGVGRCFSGTFVFVALAYTALAVLFFAGVIPVADSKVVGSWSLFGDTTAHVFAYNCVYGALLFTAFSCCLCYCFSAEKILEQDYSGRAEDYHRGHKGDSGWFSSCSGCCDWSEKPDLHKDNNLKFSEKWSNR